MKRIIPALSASLLAAVSLNAAADSGTTRHDLTLPVVELNNPCTAGHDSIDGSLDLRGITQHNGNVTFLQIQGKGNGVDANGVKYNLLGKVKFQFHDPLPARLFIKLKMVSQGSGDNAQATLAVHVNEQGNITQAEFSGVECKG